ncbi:glycosyltransferase family A protein [Methanolobus sp.]|uniref:glycosyltransferase n=1 Tax=Methanolobus sp. TaxID=1874737 RepID=UPI0025FA0255|nr:glycosyltransferase family A protein [Methanolobus sp.]
MCIRVSIVIPTYNRSSSLRQTVDSLLQQTFPIKNYEIIICDDSSKDDTAAVVKEIINRTNHNIKYLKVQSPLKGPGKVRNAGINVSSGSIIGFTDDDCVVSSNWIEDAVKTFNLNENICGVSGAVITEGRCQSKFKIPRKVTVLSDEGSYVTSNIFYKKYVLLEAGCFDVSMRYLEDIELGWRVEKVGPIMFNPSLLVKHKLFCMSFKDYLKKMSFIEYWVLMYKKHPEHRKKDQLLFGRINNKRLFYVIFTLLGIISYPLIVELSYLFSGCALISYIFTYVAYDKNVSQYALRILKLPINFFMDFLRFIYSMKASIKNNFFMFY